MVDEYGFDLPDGGFDVTTTDNESEQRKEGSQQTGTSRTSDAPPAPPASASKRSPVGQLGTAMFPTTAVPFSRWEAWVRLGVYGALAMATWKRARTVSYVSIAAASLSTASSLGAHAFRE